MEDNSNIIYNNSSSGPYLKLLLERIYTSIIKGEECTLSHFASCYTIININSSTLPPIITEMKESSVPITYLSESEIDDIQCSFGRALLKYARAGDFNIKKIYELMENRDQVTKYYERAMHLGIVYLVDMFSLDNRYCLTPTFHKYLIGRPEHPQLKNICTMVAKGQKKKREKIKDSS